MVRARSHLCDFVPLRGFLCLISLRLRGEAWHDLVLSHCPPCTVLSAMLLDQSIKFWARGVRKNISLIHPTHYSYMWHDSPLSHCPPCAFFSAMPLDQSIEFWATRVMCNKYLLDFTHPNNYTRGKIYFCPNNESLNFFSLQK